MGIRGQPSFAYRGLRPKINGGNHCSEKFKIGFNPRSWWFDHAGCRAARHVVQTHMQLCSPARLTLGKTNRVIYAERFRRIRMNDRFDKGWQKKNEKWRPKNGSQILEAFLQFLPNGLLEVLTAWLGSSFILVTSLFTLRQSRPSGLLCSISHNRATRGHSSISVRACRQQCFWWFAWTRHGWTPGCVVSLCQHCAKSESQPLALCFPSTWLHLPGGPLKKWHVTQEWGWGHFWIALHFLPSRR